MQWTLSDFDYALPDELIAQAPLAERSASRLMRVDADASGRPLLEDRRFSELPQLLEPGDLLVFNDSRVLKARLEALKPSGGKVEILAERLLDARTMLAQLRASHAPKPGSRLTIVEGPCLVVEARAGRFFRLCLADEARGGDCDRIDAVLERWGSVPLPPYIRRAADAGDAARYQTVYAREPGSVAAPTAGLHFDQALLTRLTERGVRTATVTLHVGAGTFLPVQSEDIASHRMHGERYWLDASTVALIEATRAAGGAVVAVGTTTVRTLESAALPAAASGRLLQAGSGETEIFIRPGFEFRVVDRLITNLHLPRSTLLMLVAAFAGYETVMAAYRHAVQARYRFFSYGDAMLLSRRRRSSMCTRSA